MNALLTKDFYPIEKIAVRMLIIIFASAIFLGDNLYFWSKAETINTENYGVNLEIRNSENTVKEEKEISQKLWNVSLNVRYKNAPIRHVADGIVHIRLIKNFKGKPVKINVIEINRKINPDIEIMPVLAGEKLAKKANILTLSKKNNSIAAVNGSFFMPKTGVPLGIMMIDKKILTGPIYNRVALGITESGFKTDRVSLDAKLTYGENVLTVNNLNIPRMLSTDTIVYDGNWGKKSPAPPKNGVLAVVENKQLVKLSYESVEIPESGFVISGQKEKINEFITRKEVRKFFGKKNNEPEIIFEMKTNPDWTDVKHIISGGPYLVKNGNLYVDCAEEKFNSIAGRNPRTAAGYTKDDNFIIVTIDGREESSVGVNLYDLAKIMKNFGCYNAINLDGGSSTVMQVNGNIVNSPSVKGGIPVSNALTVNIPQKLAQN